MSWHANRHSGGVRGTRLSRADCPVCGRDTAGGNRNRERTEIQLKPHRRADVAKRGALRPWCPGGGMTVRWR
jgi:hypothetical protein